MRNVTLLLVPELPSVPALRKKKETYFRLNTQLREFKPNVRKGREIYLSFASRKALAKGLYLILRLVI